MESTRESVMDEKKFEDWDSNYHSVAPATHPPFALQDQYALAPHLLIEEERAHIEAHLHSCAFCTRMQERLKKNPEEMLEVWGAYNPNAPTKP